MLEIYRTKNKDVHRKTEILLKRKLSGGFTVRRTENGKPYVDGNPLYFSVSHSSDRALIALCDRPVGIDLEYYDKDDRLKNFGHILNRFTDREKQWINGSFVFFFLNWISKEAYIKMIGGTLAKDLKRLEFFDYTLYCDGKKVDGHTVMADLTTGPYAVCAEGYTRKQLSDCPVKQFRLQKGEMI